MIAIVMTMLLAHPASLNQPQIKLEMSVVSGVPGATVGKGEREILSNPVLIARDKQEVLFNVAQSAPIVVDIEKKGDAIKHTLSNEKVGITVRVTPSELEDGTLFLKGSFTARSVTAQTSLLEQTMRFHELTTMGKALIVPLYNPNETVAAGQGKKIWLEVKATRYIPGEQPDPTPAQIPRLPRK